MPYRLHPDGTIECQTEDELFHALRAKRRAAQESRLRQLARDLVQLVRATWETFRRPG